jgi:polar amino acid transport system substrate-binding protein
MKRLGLFLWSILFSVAQADVVILNANESFPYWSEKLPHNGLGGELVEAISNAAGLETRIEYVPLKRMIEDTTNNDLGNPAFYMVNQDFAAIIPIAITQVALHYYNPTHQKIIPLKSINDLKPYRIGALSGTITNRASFEQLGIHIETSYSQESLFKKLHHGRLDIVLEIDLIGQQNIGKLFPTEQADFSVIPLPHSVSAIAIMLDDNYPNAAIIAQRYREGLAQIIKNGRYSEIIGHYYLQPPAASWFKELNRFTHLYESTVP